MIATYYLLPWVHFICSSQWVHYLFPCMLYYRCNFASGVPVYIVCEVLLWSCHYDWALNTAALLNMYTEQYSIVYWLKNYRVKLHKWLAHYKRQFLHHIFESELPVIYCQFIEKYNLWTVLCTDTCRIEFHIFLENTTYLYFKFFFMSNTLKSWTILCIYIL